MFGLNCERRFKRIPDQVTVRVYKRIRCQVMCVYMHRISHATLCSHPPHIFSPPLLNLSYASPYLRVHAFVFQSFVCLWVCSASLLHCLGSSSRDGQAVPESSSAPSIPNQSRSIVCFSFTVNIVTALTKGKAPEPCLDLNAPLGCFWFLRFCHFEPRNIYLTEGHVLAGQCLVTYSMSCIKCYSFARVTQAVFP